MIALLAPGQGSQTEGMLSPWLQLPGAADQIAAWSKAADLDLARLGTTASTEEITDTAVAQPLIVAATLLAHQELARRCVLAGKDVIVAGHSVGEIAAYAIAGVIAADDAVALAATRGAEMAKACATEPTGMSAVLGGDETEVLSRLEQLDLVPANRNAAGQIVAAGRLTALEKLAEDPPAKARVRALGVAGAFHTEFMAPALDGFAAAAANIATADPTATLLSNRDGKPVTSAAAAMDTLVSQLTQPVRWTCAPRRCANTQSRRSWSSPPRARLAVSPNANFGGFRHAPSSHPQTWTSWQTYNRGLGQNNHIPVSSICTQHITKGSMLCLSLRKKSLPVSPRSSKR